MKSLWRLVLSLQLSCKCKIILKLKGYFGKKKKSLACCVNFLAILFHLLIQFSEVLPRNTALGSQDKAGSLISWGACILLKAERSSIQLCRLDCNQVTWGHRWVLGENCRERSRESVRAFSIAAFNCEAREANSSRSSPIPTPSLATSARKVIQSEAPSWVPALTRVNIIPPRDARQEIYTTQHLQEIKSTASHARFTHLHFYPSLFRFNFPRDTALPS